MKQLETTRFGTLEIADDQVITLTQPILGFQSYRRFILLPGPPDSYLFWLQSTEAGELAFILLDPFPVVPGYTVEIGKADLAELAADAAEEIAVFTLMVVPADRTKIRTNLRAPILVNLQSRLGKQTILDKTDYPIQFYLASQPTDQGEPEEKTHAGSDA